MTREEISNIFKNFSDGCRVRSQWEREARNAEKRREAYLNAAQIVLMAEDVEAALKSKRDAVRKEIAQFGVHSDEYAVEYGRIEAYNHCMNTVYQQLDEDEP